MRNSKFKYIAPQAKIVSVRCGYLLEGSLPIYEEEESPHVTDDSQVYAQPTNVWEEELE